jgi:hypothetical protein
MKVSSSALCRCSGVPVPLVILTSISEKLPAVASALTLMIHRPPSPHRASPLSPSAATLNALITASPG